jgi:CRP/FNR family transcriptional regulator
MFQSIVVPITQQPGISEEAPAACFSHFSPTLRVRQRFSANEHLFHEGDQPAGIMQILSGIVTLYRVTADGRRHIQGFSGRGDIVALSFGEEHEMSAEALTDVEVYFVSRPVFEQAIQNNPAIRKDLIELFSRMLRTARELPLLLGLKSAMERSASFLLFLDSRFGAEDDGFVPIPMRRSDIGDHLGLTIETVSRMFNKLKKQGVIDLPRPDQFRILSRRALLAYAGERDKSSRAALYA